MTNEKLAKLVEEANADFKKLLKIGQPVNDLIIKLEIMYAATLSQYYKNEGMLDEILKNSEKHIRYFLETMDIVEIPEENT